jgi:hypothetical protein
MEEERLEGGAGTKLLISEGPRLTGSQDGSMHGHDVTKWWKKQCNGGRSTFSQGARSSSSVHIYWFMNAVKW